MTKPDFNTSTERDRATSLRLREDAAAQLNLSRSEIDKVKYFLKLEKSILIEL